MKLEENTLRDLLSGEAEKERRAYKRSTSLMLITLLVGLSWLGLSAYKVVELERQSSQLNQEIKAQTEELSETKRELMRPGMSSKRAQANWLAQMHNWPRLN